MLTIHGHEGDGHAQLAGQAMRELDVEAHQIARFVEKGERQRVRQVADPERLASVDGFERGQRRGRGGHRSAGDGGLGRVVQQVH